MTITVRNFILQALDAGVLLVNAAEGHVYSNNHMPPKRLGCISAAGYLVATLHFLGIRKQIKLHQVVWLAVHGDFQREYLIDHISRVRSDNRISNLRLVDKYGNANNRRTYKGSGNPAAKLSEQQVLAIRDTQGRDVDVAAQFGVGKSLVSLIRRREIWSHLS